VNELDQKIEAIQVWIDKLRQSRATDSAVLNASETTLSDIVQLIHPFVTPISPPTGSFEPYADMKRQIQQQTAALIRSSRVLKSQIIEREVSVSKLLNAFDDLERHLHDHVADHARLDQRLEAQIDECERLQDVEREERALSEALRDTLATMSGTLDLGKILDHILDSVGRVTPYDGANVLLVESDLVHVVRQRGYVAKEVEREWLKQRIPVTKLATLQQLIDIGKPLAIPDTTTSPMWIGFPNLAWVNSNVIAPIRSNGKILGFISLDSATAGYFTQVDAERLQTFADQAAIAIQNARLLDRAKRAAVMAERNRLANELHDTISQTLWSISLITERLPAIWAIDQEEGGRSLTTLHELAQNALAEMRALLLELHPSSLTETPLGDLIRQVAEVVANRTGLKISVRAESQEPVPPEVHFALYRVVQESLNNVALHASASHVEIVFSSHLGRVDLSIRDDGLGFNPANVGPGHLGLSIMQDRVQNIGGTMEAVSRKGEGTLIKVIWEVPTD